MDRRETVGSIDRPSNSVSMDAERPNFILYVDVREPQIHEVWTFGEDGVTCEFHPTARVNVGAGVVGEFATDYLTESWCRIPMFVRTFINGSV